MHIAKIPIATRYFLFIFLLNGCTAKETSMNAAQLNEFATRYTAAWCSQDAASVAFFYSENGSLKINAGDPSTGRDAITVAAQGFMTAFPDMVVEMNDLSLDGDHVIYHWTLIGTNNGPDGSGNAVRISGFEQWTIGADNLIGIQGEFRRGRISAPTRIRCQQTCELN